MALNWMEEMCKVRGRWCMVVVPTTPAVVSGRVGMWCDRDLWWSGCACLSLFDSKSFARWLPKAEGGYQLLSFGIERCLRKGLFRRVNSPYLVIQLQV